jgi:hypothetical protein
MKSPFDLSIPSTLFSAKDIQAANRSISQSRKIDAVRATGVEPWRMDFSKTTQASQDKRNLLMGKSFA